MSANDPAHASSASRNRNVYDATMQAMHAGSTDAKLDALGEKIEDLGRRMDERFEQVDKRFEQFDKRFERLEDRFDRLQQTMMGGGFLIIAALIGVIATQL
jgi:flagellar capping protein FliD